MRAEDANTGDEVVYLLTELRAAGQGQVFEIGSRARVLGADGDRLTLAVAYGNGEDVVTCPRSLVARRRQPLPPRRSYLRADAVPAS